MSMIKYIFTTLFTCVMLHLQSEVHAALVDSVGTVVKNGKNFTLHKVAPKETLYALARKYKVSVAQIQQANLGVTALAVGQTIYVPGREAVAVETQAILTKPNAAASVPAPVKSNLPAAAEEAGNRVHIVTNRQTLFAIARLYNVSTSDIKKWNGLTSDNLKEGQSLVIASNTQPDNAASTAITAAATGIKAEAKEMSPAPGPKPALPKEVKPEVVPAREKPAEKVERTETRYTESLSRISESGLAEVMDQHSDNNKYLALHKTAPIGTILQVKNTMNNQSVYVRVSGKLPEGSANDKLIIRISKRAYQKLAAADNRLRVEVNYMP